MIASSLPSFIDTPDALAALCGDLEREPEIALDTEFVRERSYIPKLELLQVATRAGEIAIIDVGRLGRPAGDRLGPVLGNRASLKVLHAADQDLEMLEILTGEIPGPIWDTQLVAGLFGYSGRSGYAAMVEALVGSRPKSGESLTDWSRRPLAPEQLTYAAEDVRYLLPLYELEREKLGALGRLHWAEEECEAVRERLRGTLARKAEEVTGYQRVRGWQKLRPRGLAVLRELVVWREREAERRNRPSSTVVRDDILVEIARRAPSSPDQLRTLRGVPPALLERHGGGLVAAVEAGKRVPTRELPAAAPATAELEESERALVWLVQAALQGLASEKQVAPGLLTTSADVQRLVTAHRGGEPVETLRLFRGWRGELVGDELRAVLDGQRALSWDPRSARLRLTRA